MKNLDRGSKVIAAKEMTFLGRRYLPGDRFDYQRMGIAHRRTIERLMSSMSRKLVELDAESMRQALRFRPAGSNPPRGFTLSGLKGLGYLTDEQIQQHGWARVDQESEIGDDVAPWAPTEEGAYKVFAAGADEERSTDDTTLWVVPFKTGGATRYFVHDLKGERISGEASLNGKAKTEQWARDWLAEKAANAETERGGDPDWKTFPDDEDEWSDDQVAEFDAWYDALQPGAEVQVDHEVVTRLIAERRTAEAKEAELLAGRQPTEDGAGIIGLNAEEAAELLDAMTEDELRSHVQAVTGRDMAALVELTPLALRELLDEHQATKGAQNDGHVQPEPDGAQG